MKNSSLSQGIEAAARGDYPSARTHFMAAVKAEPRNEEAWLMLGHVLENPEQQRMCYEKVLQLNPKNELAKLSLKQETQPGEMLYPPEQVMPAIPDKTPISIPEKPDKPKKEKGKLFSKHPWMKWVLIGSASLAGILCIAVMSFVLKVRKIHLEPLDYVVVDTIPEIAYKDRDYKAAMKLMKNKRFIKAYDAWEEIINEDASDDFPHYQQAICLFEDLIAVGSQEEYTHNLEIVAKVLNNAISIAPEKKEYLLLRQQIASGFGYMQYWRVDRFRAFNLAAEDGLKGLTLDLPQEQKLDIQRRTAEALIDAYRCQEGLDMIDEVLSAITPEHEDYYAAMRVQSKGYACNEQADLAVESITIAMQDNDALLDKEYLKAVYLYEAGRTDESLDMINESISHFSGSGWRYFLRATILAESGDYEAAIQDLYTGESSTWDRNGYYCYAQARIAMAQDDTYTAMEWLQYAEASFASTSETTRKQVLSELEEYGFPPLQVEPIFEFPGVEFYD